MYDIQPNIKNQEFFELLKEKIRKKQSFSMLRLGDGEARILKKKHSIMKKLKRNWFQEDATIDYMLSTFYQMLQKTMTEADAIGIFPFQPFVEDLKTYFSADTSQEIQERAQRLFGNPLNYTIPLRTVPVKNKIFFDAGMFRRQTYGNIKSYRELFQGEPIHLISCMTEGLKNNQIDEALDCEITFTQVPHQTRYSELLTLVDIGKIKEGIIVFGTGGGGKWITSKTKKHGKIGLDLGSVLNGWAGQETRGEELASVRKHLILKNRRI